MSMSLLATIVIVVFILATAIGMWASSRRAKPLVGGLGLLLIPLGLFLLGITQLAVHGIESIVAWVERTQWGPAMTWGVGLVGAGFLLCVVAAFLPGGRKEQLEEANRSQPLLAGRTQDQPALSGKTQPLSAQRRSAPERSGDKSPTKGRTTGKDGLTDEDREIEALLKQRGIM